MTCLTGKAMMQRESGGVRRGKEIVAVWGSAEKEERCDKKSPKS